MIQRTGTSSLFSMLSQHPAVGSTEPDPEQKRTKGFMAQDPQRYLLQSAGCIFVDTHLYFRVFFLLYTYLIVLFQIFLLKCCKKCPFFCFGTTAVQMELDAAAGVAVVCY